MATKGTTAPMSWGSGDSDTLVSWEFGDRWHPCVMGSWGQVALAATSATAPHMALAAEDVVALPSHSLPCWGHQDMSLWAGGSAQRGGQSQQWAVS